MTKAKFKCISKTIDEAKANHFVFVPVITGSEENKSFWKYTPSGKLEMACLNENVDFTPGKEYYLTITEA